VGAADAHAEFAPDREAYALLALERGLQPSTSFDDGALCTAAKCCGLCRFRKNSQTAAATADVPAPARARRDSSRADFCYLGRSPNNMPVRIVDHILARSATWLARPEGFEPPTPRFVVGCSPSDAVLVGPQAAALVLTMGNRSGRRHGDAGISGRK